MKTTICPFLLCPTRDLDIEVNGSCEVKPSESWCVMTPLLFDEVLSVSTECDARATDGDGATLDQSPSWDLCNVGKRSRRDAFEIPEFAAAAELLPSG